MILKAFLFLASLYDIFNNRDVPDLLIYALFLPVIMHHTWEAWPLVVGFGILWILGLLGPGDAIALIALTLYMGWPVLDVLMVASYLALLFLAGFVLIRFGAGFSPLYILVPFVFMLPRPLFMLPVVLSAAIISAKEKELKEYFKEKATDWFNYPTVLWKKTDTAIGGIAFLPFIFLAFLCVG